SRGRGGGSREAAEVTHPSPYFGPRGLPVLLGLADVAAVVTAVRGRRRPVVDVLPPRLVLGMELRAVLLVGGQRAGLGVDRRLAERLRALLLRLRRDDVVHPEVHAVRVLG